MVPKGLAGKFIGYALAASLVMAGVADVWGQEKPQAALGRVAALGEISEGEKRIILNRAETFLSRRYDLVSQIDYEAAEEEAFAQLEADQCTEEACIRIIQEILQVERFFILQIIREGTFTQLSLSLYKLDSRRIEEAMCENCTINDLHARMEGLANRLIGEDLGAAAPPVAAPVPEPAPAKGGTLFLVGLTPEHHFLVDGAPITPDERGTLAVDPGSHNVRISRDGFLALEITAQAEVGKITRLNVELEPVTGYLTVIGSPEGAAITIDGGQFVPTQTEETLPLSLRALPIGEYRLNVSADRHEAQTQEVTIRKDEESRVEIELRDISEELAVREAYDEELTTWSRKWGWTLTLGLIATIYGLVESNQANRSIKRTKRECIDSFDGGCFEFGDVDKSSGELEREKQEKVQHRENSEQAFAIALGFFIGTFLIYQTPPEMLDMDVSVVPYLHKDETVGVSLTMRW